MSISMPGLGANGIFPTYEHYRRCSTVVVMYLAHCCRCGFQPDDPFRIPDVCPKCHGGSFARTPVPGSLLAGQNARDGRSA